jgi:ABC-type nitrate/sulfonate/bicarbonate transport system substrate-binding protein/nitrogen-specific signal transduction histidine kinase
LTRLLQKIVGIFLLSFIISQTYALETVTLQLTSQHKFQFSGYYAAKAKGFYEQAGLTVNILEATQGVDTIDSVLSNEAQYGVGSNNLLLAHQAGKPVVVLGVIFQQSPSVLLAKRKDSTPSIEDLAYKRVTLNGQRDELIAYFLKQKIDLKALITTPRSFNIAALINDDVDMISAYITDEPYQLEQGSIPYRLFTPSSAGIHFYGDNFFTSRAELSAHPERVKAFREASLKGWRYALAHPDEIIDIILSGYSTTKERGELQYEAAQMMDLIHPELVEIGYMLEARWQHIAVIYESVGMLPESPSQQDIALTHFLYNPNQQQDLSLFYWALSVILVFLVLMSFTTLYLVKSNQSLKQLLYFRNHHANIGESINHVSHQWQQPLNNLGVLFMQLEQTIKYEKSHQEKLLDICAKCNRTLQFMADSVDSFRNLMSTKDTNTKINLADVIDEVILLLQDNFERREISVTTDLMSSININGNNTELANVLLSIFINARDNFVKRATAQPSLHIQLTQTHQSIVITIEDNGGGIKVEPIENIFKIGETTNKMQHEGIGLYIAKRIISNKFDGCLKANNHYKGACFTITLPLAAT